MSIPNNNEYFSLYPNLFDVNKSLPIAENCESEVAHIIEESSKGVEIFTLVNDTVLAHLTFWENIAPFLDGVQLNKGNINVTKEFAQEQVVEWRKLLQSLNLSAN